MMKNKKLLYISQEIAPYLPDSDMAVMGKEIPVKMQEKGFEVRTFMPKYGCINERRNQLHEVIRLSGMNIIIDDTDHPLIIKVATLQPSRMQVYFIDSEDYFNQATGANAPLEIISGADDNHERIIFFDRGVVETVKKLRWEPAIVQCMGWITALTPLFIKKIMADDPTLANVKVVYALRSEGLPTPLPSALSALLGPSFEADDIAELASADSLDINALHRIAIRYADAIVQADEATDPQIIEAAVASGKPFLPFNSDLAAFADDMNTMYQQLLEPEA